MTVRLQGDGPSSWAVWLIVARPRAAEWAKWGTLPGAYVGPPPSRGSDRVVDSIVRGQKPRWLMEAVVRDYTRPGDLVADPFLGGGTTAIACQATGRRFVGSELDGMTLERARERIARPVQLDLLERREGSE